jgi:mono/diheme cytochrome c family protein
MGSISPGMNRPAKLLGLVAAAVVLAVLTSACGTQEVVQPANPELRAGAELFHQRCSGCHSLSYAAANGSAAFVRTKEYNNGPNFNIRCERPVARVLYAIANGGFSGAIMPQNVVVGQDAINVAKFVATYAGRQAPKVPGVTPCEQLPIGSVPAPVASAAAAASSGSTAGP